MKFTESSTRKVVEASAVLNIVATLYETIVTGKDNFVANEPYNFKISARMDGKPVSIFTLFMLIRSSVFI